MSLVARLIPFPRSKPEPEGPDWRAASEAAVEEHEPTLDELFEHEGAAKQRITDAAIEIVDAIKSYHALQDRIVAAVQERGGGFQMKPERICGEEIADEIDKALQGEPT